MKNFGLIGAAGYIAPKHMKAIKDTNNNLLIAMDVFDSVGILDMFFPNVDFFKEFECFQNNINLRKEKIDFISICSPNYLHDSHIRFSLKNGINAICEKPMVLNPKEIDLLIETEKETCKKVYNILQLRVHCSIINLKKRILNGDKNKIYNVDLTYITSRGPWYYKTWKGEELKSGGLISNIGIHFFDMLTWIFGKVKLNECHIYEDDRSAGYLELENARIKWFLSINKNMLTDNNRTKRSIIIDGDEFEFSKGFDDLHTVVYKNILSGNGYGINDAKTAINIVHDLRNSVPLGINENSHNLCKS